MFKIIKMTLVIIVGLILLIGISVLVFFKTAPQIGASATGDRLEEMKHSPQYGEDQFVNQQEVDTDMPFSKGLRIMYKMLTNTKQRSPQEEIITKAFDKQVWESRKEEEILISWFGHSSAIIKIDGKTILADPVFGERASMFSFMGPKKFDYSSHMTVDQLPAIDAVIISHDHYDHLDFPTIVDLAGKVDQFYVPLGVGAHLEKWGVDPAHIVVFDWWEDIVLQETIKLTFTPTQHFSGRGLTDKFATLWGSWVIEGSVQKMYFSGDSGYSPWFKEIGERFGPMDFAMIECGAYNKEDWGDIHMLPEESVQAALDVKAKVAMPIHWGKFDLALHAWKEPVTRFLKKAEENGLDTHTPGVGTILSIPAEAAHSKWWTKYE